MRPDKQVKKEFLKTAQESPERFYATEVLEKRGFLRKPCPSCGKYFWTTHPDQERCGDPACQGKVSMFEDNPAKRKMTFTEVWTTFAEHMHARGYAKIPRYPVVARWNPTTDFTMASIAAFQPYVISGAVEPPAKKLVIPQFCLRFGDVDNVGITGSHCTGFVMIGQHQFVPKEEWDQNQAFEDLLSYLTDVLGLPQDELTLHEDAWAGGGNYGPCMEFFSRGVELCNQVYMMYEQHDGGDRELQLKVLDMGLGQERVAWFSQGALTLYDATFPAVISKLKDATGVSFDPKLYRRFAPYSALLNLDEVDDIKEAWERVAHAVGVPVSELREKIEPMRALYSVAEHARSLLVALTDGALPGNVGGYYNLRVIFRRAQDFIEDNEWDVSIADVASWHAEELKDMYPELSEDLDEVRRLLGIELDKYHENKKRGAHIIEHTLKKASITNDVLVELYDSHGITPEQVRSQARKQDIVVTVPDNFYRLVEERHANDEQRTQTRVESDVDVSGITETEPLYYRSYDYASCEAKVLKVDGKNVILDRTVFYPTSGGQLHDTGTIDGERVVNVHKQGKHIIHVMEKPPSFKKGDTVQCLIDIDRRIQLAQHHTAAHVINGAARRVLGPHIWQAGAAKTPEKGRLDITHYEALSDEEMRRIEEVANEIIQEDLPVTKNEMKKSVAEAEYGFRLYQGGAVPGNRIRVVDIPGFDTEACGGTHVNTTGDLQFIKLLKSTKVQDGVVRIEYVAGKAAHDLVKRREKLEKEAMNALGIDDPKLLPSRTEELFTKWKKVKKLRKKKQDVPEELLSLAVEPSDSKDPLADAAAMVSVQEEQLPKTLERFLSELRG